ncbi:MAG: hydroxyacylglutathione hydrolase [Solirubrobacteraceae bacterium]|nr:hydroxyacylglutathione hydrolase [Solirubrobacteraceae bacterium]
MRPLADGVWQIAGLPPNAFNVYLIGDVLVDTSTRHGHRRILRQLGGRTLSAVALTHVHLDHQGSAHRICETLGVPLWCPAGEVDVMEDGDVLARMPDRLINRINDRLMTGPPHPVERPLREGDDVAGFTVLDVPGHSKGQIAYWRESDRTLIAGDVLINMSFATGLTGLHEPPAAFTSDAPRNRESARRIAELRPALALFGHGPPLRDPGRLADFVGALPGR